MLRPRLYSPRRFGKLVSWIIENGKTYSPRGQETLEMMDAHLVVRNPVDRLIFDPGRKMNLAFAIADWVQMMVGDDTLKFLTDFIPGIADFADPDDKTRIGGAYGPRIKNPALDINQVHSVIDRLAKDHDSRQAVMTIYDGQLDLLRPGHVVPCTISLQFLIRQDKLHCIANMRSNDVVWGLTYDVFNFTMIQEWIAKRLGYEVGPYHHHAGSLHLYVDRDKEMVEKLNLVSRFNARMDNMPGPIDPHRLFEIINEAKDLDSRMFWRFLGALGTQYEKDMALVTRHWLARKEEPFEAEAAYKATTSIAFRRLMKQWPIVK